MGFGVPLSSFKLNFDMENMRVKAIDANHGVFVCPFPRHMHSFYELHYIVGGRGKLILDDAEYELSEGKLFLLGPKVHHAQLTDMSYCMEEYHFAFELQYKNAGKDKGIGKFFDSCDFCICDDAYNISRVFAELESELNERKIGYMSAVQSLLERILVLTVRNFSYKASENSAVKTVPDDRRSLLMDEAFLYSYQTLTLESLAEILNLSTRHTQRLIYEKYGTSFVQLRIQARLNAAKNMIESTDLKLSQIADKCGFSNYIHFAKVFKKEFGVPPSEYKKQLTE